MNLVILSVVYYIIAIFLFYKTFNSISSSLVISSLLLNITPIATSNIQIPLILLSMLLCLVNKQFSLSPKRLIYFISVIVLSYMILILSFNMSLIHILGKLGKIASITFPLVMLKKTYSTYNSKMLWISIITLSIIGMFFWFNAEQLNSGIFNTYRLPNLSLDPNYSAIILLSFLMIKKINNIHMSSTAAVFVFILIILTQATSSMFLALIFFIFFDYIKNKSTSLFLVLFLTILIYLLFILSLSDNDSIIAIEDWQDNYISMKINSLMFRLNAQILGAQMLIHEPMHFLYGFGSGLSIELFGRVMHNSYMQILFDHGIIFLLLMFLYFNLILKKMNVYIVAIYCQLMSFMFDSYFMGIITIIYVFYLLTSNRRTNY
ncbi:MULTISPECIES: hypothetical protein [Providencia]|uniref:hypothetical protein n=1 Tax=Providencia TaxID=586 RepID=UPI0023491A88|nr:hypothetical protein [Providencia sp. PROV268]